ncbi:Maltase 1 [Frankliniella fusca]|uniref:alpha-glucosidase n=1 Tax=Frankliniella fusca TaxID=407009 RepID=A0AAE1HSP5_9NEOP|nr:Maltase 1 [Frankliniella fusca]
MGAVAFGVAALSLLLPVFTAAEPVDRNGAAQAAVADTPRKWWETAVIYQVYPRSFKDSDGDGIGDLKGITSKLDYLKDLGVGAVWLSPIYPSPQADFGYDISNYIDIDPQYGTMSDFDNLLKKTHDLGMKLVLDLVPNHSSDEHEWFKKSVQRDGKYTDYYVWNDGKKSENGTMVPPNNWNSNFRGTGWEWNEQRQQFYWHQFAVKQPDLNYRNQDIVDEMKNVLRFWLKKGVDGFRVDAVITLFEDEQLRDQPYCDCGETDPTQRDYEKPIYTENLPETYAMVKEWRKVLDEFGDDKIMMTEAYATLDQTIAYYGTPDEPAASFSFNFYLITSLNVSSSASDFKKVIDDWMGKMDDFRKPNWVIGNHDQFRVGSFFRYGEELQDGINMISLMLPGTAMTYNGEEIGMDNTYITWAQTKDPQAINAGEKDYLMKSRDLERTPFQWDSSTSAGFSTNPSTWLPVNPNYFQLNMEAQAAADRSHLKMYKALLKARQLPAVQSSNYEASVWENVLVIKREIGGADSFIVLVNFDSSETDVPIDKIGSYSSLNVWTSSLNSNLKTGDSAKSTINMRPKSSVVLTTGAVPVPSTSGSGKLTSSYAFLTVLGIIVVLAL